MKKKKKVERWLLQECEKGGEKRRKRRRAEGKVEEE